MPMVIVLLGDVGDGDVEALVFRHALYVVEVARAASAPSMTRQRSAMRNDGQVGAHHALVIEEVGIDALADIGIATDLGGAEPFHQLHMVGASSSNM